MSKHKYSLEEARAALTQYEADGNVAVLPSCDPDEVRWDVYKVVFKDRWDVYEWLCLEHNKRTAQNSYSNFLEMEDPKEGYINVVSMLACTMISDYVWCDEYVIEAKSSFARLLTATRECWTTIWSEVPQFEERLRDKWKRYQGVEFP